ncbi:VOC family protein [Parasphingorhabdus sp.]|uniref:VOC family protein n=1 Tax=Parasphingorhabdus sp. TaxID=2709688 RepID=UPI003BB1D971
MNGITELGYVRLGVSSLADWRHFAGELLGLEVCETADPAKLLLRTDLWHNRIILEENSGDDILAAGLRVAGEAEFNGLLEKLATEGVSFEVADKADAEANNVLAMARLSDPNDLALEIFHGPRVDTHRPFYPGRGMFGHFVTGDGGFGHMMLSRGDLSALAKFYTLLGMRGGIEYKVPIPTGETLELLFLHCNQRDHTLSFGMPGKRRLDHLMLEVSTLDDVFLTYERLTQANIDIAITPGKHANDQMFSFYCISPSGFQVEIGWGPRTASHQSEYYAVDTFGHDFTPAGMPTL